MTAPAIISGEFFHEPGVTASRSVYCAILGVTEIRVEGIRLTPEAERQFGMALYFCMNAGSNLARDDAAEMFWPDHDIEAARHCLRQATYRLRAVGIPVRSGAKATMLDERVVDADYKPVVAVGAPPGAFLGLGSMAVLPGYSPRFSTPFAQWVDDTRADISGRLRRGLVRAISDARARGRYAEVERLSRHCLTLDPLNEEATLALAESVALAGGKAEAVGMIERYERELGERRGLRLPARILRSRVSDLIVDWQSQGKTPVPLIGREAELEWLLAVLREVSHGEPRAVTLWGEAGIGKTSIVEEFLRIAGLQTATVVRVLCQGSDAERPLSALCEVMTQLLALRGAIGASPQSLADLQPLVSYRAASTLKAGDDELGASPAARRRLLDAASDVIDAVADENPLVLVLDDAHWMDEDSLRLLAVAGRRSAARRLFLITCCRKSPRYSPAVLGILLSEAFDTRQIRPLSTDASRRLADVLLGSVETMLPEGRIEDLLQLAGGNPLFMVELVRRVCEHPYESLPDSLATLLDGRIQARTALGTTVLQACSVLGKYATLDRLERVLELPAFELAAALHELEGSALVSADGNRIHCRHELIADAVERSMAQSASALLRQRAAVVLEVDAQSLGDPALLWQSARCWEATKQYADARRVLEELGEYLVRIGSPREAASALEQALSYCQSDEQRIEGLEQIVRCLRAAGDWNGILRTLDLRSQLLRDGGLLEATPDLDTIYRFEALFRLVDDLPALLRLVIAKLEKESLPDAQIALAEMALILADNTLNAKIAAQVFRSLRTIDPAAAQSNRRATTASMIYHSTFGDLQQATLLARTLHDGGAYLAAADVHELQRQRWSAQPLIFSGQFSEARAVLTMVYNVALERRLHIESSEAALRLVTLELSEGDEGAAHQWMQLAWRAIRQAEAAVTQVDASFTESVLLFWQGRYSAAYELIRQIEPFAASAPDSRVRLRFLGLKLAVDGVIQSEPSAGELKELHSLLSRGWSFGENDIPVFALVKGYERIGDTSAVNRVRQQYSSARRELYPIPAQLATVIIEAP